MNRIIIKIILENFNNICYLKAGIECIM